MKRISVFLVLSAALALTACTGESNLPQPTGKGGLRGINAIPGSPVVSFRIEERTLDNLTYKSISTPALYDNFEYNFNFDITLPGEDDPQRIATVATKIEDGQEYVFVLSGDLSNPVVTVWDSALRDWAGTETVFEARFGHLAESLGDIDVYFYDESGPAPVQGEQVATLSYGEVMDVTDFEDGNYIALITAAGDISTVYHQSEPTAVAARSSHLLSLFDGDANDTSPWVIRSMSAAGVSQRWPDPGYPPTIRIIQGAATLPAVDIYNDETLTNQVAANLSLGQVTTDLAAASDGVTWYFTPAGSTATVLFSQAISSLPLNSPTELYVIGTTDNWAGVNLAQDRASAETVVKLSLFHSAINAATMDMYVVDRGATVAEDAFPKLSRIGYGLPSATTVLAAGSYDIYLTELFTKTILGGPYELDVETGDVVFLLAYDDELNPGSVIIENVSLP